MAEPETAANDDPALLPSGRDGTAQLAKFFRALGDPTRLRLLEYLLGAEHTVTECIKQVEVSQGRVSSHLACLADCGYVQARRVGRHAFYTAADPRVADLVLLARALAADNHAALAACRRIDPGHGADGTAGTAAGGQQPDAIPPLASP